jgi:two-component system chemotaxis response regulator CheY
MPKRVLDVGNCAYDHGAISALLSREFQAQTVAAHSAPEALREAASGQYDLVLVNRLLDADGSEGLAIIESLREDPATKNLPVMMITNLADAAATAVAAGATPGFGKKSLYDPQTRERLAKILSPVSKTR